jgi:hypothetical protein
VSGTVEAVVGAVLSSQRKAGCAGGDGVAGVALFVLRTTGLVSLGLVSVAAGLVIEALVVLQISRLKLDGTCGVISVRIRAYSTSIGSLSCVCMHADVCRELPVSNHLP